jgi:glycosyl transferase family 1
MVRRYGSRLSVVIVGYVTVSEQLRSIRENITLLDPIWNVDDYRQLLSETDINIAVLKPSFMADCKSEIKWLEAAMFAIPSAVSRTATYAEVIENGIAGFLCSTSADWVAALDRLVRNPDLRRDMGLAAQRKVRSLYSLGTMASNLRSIFDACPTRVVVTKPTVVVVNVFYPPQSFGGATLVVHDNVKHIVTKYSDDFTIEVFTSIEAAEDAYQTHSYVHDGVRVTSVTTPHVPDCDQRPRDQRMAEIFGEFLDSVNPALVHFHCIQR